MVTLDFAEILALEVFMTTNPDLRGQGREKLYSDYGARQAARDLHWVF